MLNHRSTTILAAAAALLGSASANAGTDPTGIWFDHNGRGAVEIKECENGNGMCGYVVHIKDAKNASRCGLQILGNVTDGGGWIYSPERKNKYDVEIKRLSDDKLRVVGNAGSRFFSRTFTWNRAPDDIERCDGTTAEAAPAEEAQPEAAETTTKTKTEAKPVKKVAAKTTPVTTGSPTGSSALFATTRPKINAADRPVTAEAEKPVTETKKATTETKKPVEETKKKTKTAAADDTAASTDEVADDLGIERKCKFKIPYVGRTVMVPCRN